jgi:hypothetical protein
MAFGLGNAGGATVRLAVDDTAFNRAPGSFASPYTWPPILSPDESG